MNFVSGSEIKIENKYPVTIIFKINYMLISKYIVVIFLSLFSTKSFRWMGVGGEGKATQDFEI